MGDFLPVRDALAYLAGSRRVLRSVRDLTSGAEGEFTGRTVFSPRNDGGLLHRETGTFVWQSVPRPAERTLCFLPGHVPGTADVRFADGRPFHDRDLTSGRWRTDHPCAADPYGGAFEVHDEDRRRTVWRVGGPAKQQLLVTDLTRERTP
ncbi:hypothetical protein SAMN06272781_6664 [Streptomyces sp. 1222.2]|uniref:DUF6314 family protein n=1 Tax=Streptomyces sp. 1222.2 TaxID=1938833 RepID=UPI000BCA0058|nr:DUF6314 family protein [Streptomyces sp. 1222.2]SOD79651.1 hypothetical protein SAMN06272781_6664 [Streptomyces sp. 1222.2]